MRNRTIFPSVACDTRAHAWTAISAPQQAAESHPHPRADIAWLTEPILSKAAIHPPSNTATSTLAQECLPLHEAVTGTAVTPAGAHVPPSASLNQQPRAQSPSLEKADPRCDRAHMEGNHQSKGQTSPDGAGIPTYPLLSGSQSMRPTRR